MDPTFEARETAIPAPVLELARGRPVRVVWTNSVGGVTCEYGHGEARRFVKWSPAHASDLADEAARLDWAGRYIRVPVVVESGSDGDGSWMMTLPLLGENAVTKRWLADPGTSTRAIGEGLRALHDALPVAGCPFSWSAAERVADAERRAGSGLIDRDEWDQAHAPIDLPAALARARDIPEVDALVVCHGDTCAPNTLIDDRGHWSGHVDFGTMGVADRWADLAIATLSTEWNYGPGWEQAVLDAYGIEPDPERTRYYRLLWELDP
jgi:aminoglycoside phosphotransferase